MTPETYERLWVVFEEVRQREPGARGLLLDERCGGDPELRTEVEKLLDQADGEATELLGAPGPLNVKAHWPTAAAEALIGRRVGPYEIQACLGEGGMGCVYLAVRRADYEQHVAIKWIKPGRDTADILRRFHHERQVLAALRHPNIAALLDGGTLEGRPYFVMEYIDGTPIDDYCRRRGLTVPDCLRLFLVVAATVHHAHQNLVLHRDLKPGNILVDAAGVPKLLDFGIAKMLTPDADGPRTQSGHLYATPEYASPEQLGGDSPPNTTGDVYSLGVILYELLTGHRPHEAAGRSPYALMRAVCAEEPPPPRHWRPELPYDLEVICLKCLQKEPARRFPSVASLADELERFLAGQPIHSRPVGACERAVKWARRRPATAALVGVSTLALLLLLAVNLWYTRQLEGAITAETQAKDRLQQEKERADANLLVTLGLLEKKLVGVKRGKQREWLGRQRRQELLEVLDRFDVLEQMNSDRAPMTQLRAHAYGQMAALQELLGEYPQAERSLGQALAIQRRLRQETPENRAYQQELAGALHDLGRVRANARHVREAEAAYREAIELHQQLVAAAPEPAYRDTLGRDLHNLGQLLARDPARQAEARAAYEEAIRLHEQLARERPDAVYQEALNQHRYQLRVLEGAGLDEKEKACRQRINDLEERAAGGQASLTQSHNLAMYYHELGRLLALKAREALAAARKQADSRPLEVDPLSQDAENAFERAVELHEALAEANPDVIRYRRSLAQHYVDLGDLFLWTARQPLKAREPYQAGLDLLQELVAKDAIYQGDLGCTYEKLGQMWLRVPEPDRSAAGEALNQAVGHLQLALKEAPDNMHYRKILDDAIRALHDLHAHEQR